MEKLRHRRPVTRHQHRYLIVSLFRIFKYSSILFFLGKYKAKLFRVVAVLLFALITSLLYQDVADYLQQQYPETVIYALIAKIIIVYGALAFVLLQFRPEPDDKASVAPGSMQNLKHEATVDSQITSPDDRLAALEDVSQTDKLQSRYDRVISRDDD